MRDYETRHLFLAAAIVLLILSPFVLLVLPTGVIGALYHSKSQLVLYVMSKSYLVYAAGLFFLFLSVFVIFLLWGKKSVVLVSLTCLILSGFSFFIAAQHYISIGSDKLSYRMLFSTEEHTYHWNEIERGIYYEDEHEKVAPTYEFVFTDGNSVKLPENDYLQEYKYMIRNLIKNAGTELEEKFYE
ncbi:hypothetical protein [Sporosarcina sp. 6E9]|uniref:hypothetical protein n=1 Tax=Sporosarcina sp. 6E9 TaxID=2819235 RepID=UPI001B3122B3|nr:hypothetical protein [Sporosarcina sp. 6E9]